MVVITGPRGVIVRLTSYCKKKKKLSVTAYTEDAVRLTFCGRKRRALAASIHQGHRVAYQLLHKDEKIIVTSECALEAAGHTIC